MPTTNPAVTGTLAVGQIPYTNLVHRSGPDVVLGSNNLWWAAAEARLGVGTSGAVPSAKAHVVGDGAPAARPLALRVDGTDAARGEMFFGDISLSTYSTDEVVFEICTPARAATRSRGFRYAGGAQTSVAGGELVDFNAELSSVQFSTGTTLALQRGALFAGPTYSATSAKTITEAASLAITAPTAGTNVSWGSYAGGSTVFALKTTGAGGAHFTVSASALVPGPALDMCYAAGACTAVPAASEIVCLYGGAGNGGDTITWSGAPAATQRWWRIQGPQYARTGGASTITNAATVYIERAPIAGTNISITNAYALWVADGTARFDGSLAVNNITQNAGGTVNNWLLYDSGTSRIRISTALGTLSHDINLIGSTSSNGICVKMQNLDAAGISGSIFYSSSSVAKGYLGYGNASATGSFTDRLVLGFVDTTDVVFLREGTSVSGCISGTDGRFGWGLAPAGLTTARWFEVAQPVATTGSPNAFAVTGAAHTTLSNAEASDVVLALARTVQFGQNTTLATQRAVAITAPTYSSSAATKTITDAVTLDITAAPTAGTNVTITNPYALRVQAGETRLLGGLRVTGNLGFFGGAAVAQQTVGAVTNNVTSGGSSGVIADYAIVDYATDSTTIRNNQYQLARSVAQLATAVRNLSLGA